MEDFYPFTFQDLPRLSSLVRENNIELIFITGTRNTALASLRPLAEGLLSDVNKFEEIRQSCLEDKEVQNLKGHVLEKCIELVKLWLEENNGRGNFMKLINILRTNDPCIMSRYLVFSAILEKLILDYSLSNDVYSLSKEFLFEDSPPSVNQVLSNAYLLENIFKSLEFKDKKSFREVNSLWNKESLRLWRKYAKINIKVDGSKRGVSIEEFVDLLEKERERVEEKSSQMDLTRYPFRSFHLNYFPGWDSIKNSKAGEFWELVGSQIEDLQIDNLDFPWNSIDTFPEDLFKKCQNLKTFNLLNITSNTVDFSNEEVEVWWKGKKKGKVAEKLEELILEATMASEIIWNILFLCPNLKALELNIKNRGLEALLYPAANGEFIKLKRLQAFQFSAKGGFSMNDFYPLKNYVGMLNKKGFHSLEHLSLQDINLNYARRAPFDFHSALSLCSGSLTTLKLECNMNEKRREGRWLTDLTQISFPSLTVFKLTLENNYPSGIPDPFFFDFATLKQMPKLEWLEIAIYCAWGRYQRRPGTQDFVFEGERDSYGVFGDYLSEEISCPQLKKFSFIAWTLSREDIQLISEWFPNLTSLEAGVGIENLSFVLDTWKDLRRLNIQTGKLISLRQLRHLKEKKEHLKIIQTVAWRNLDRTVELNEHNGKLYFTFSDTNVSPSNFLNYYMQSVAALPD